jgi:predicted nucleic acid-binding protein
MKQVFLDTVGMIAVWDNTDQWHIAATAAYERLHAQSSRLITTPLILYECGNSAARRPYRADVNELREFLKKENLLIEPTPQEIEAAWAAYDRGEAAQAGIVDHISFVVMRRLGIQEVFTNDRHFQAAGFTTLF